MDFFDHPDPPNVHEMQHNEVYAQPEWVCAPQNWLPSLVPVELVIGRSEDAIVLLSGIRANPSSWDFTLVSKRRPGSGAQDAWSESFGMPPMMMHPGVYPPGMPQPDFESMLRFGFRFADGTKVTSASGSGFHAVSDDDAGPSGPMMMPGSSSGGGSAGWVSEIHAWPLPPQGEMVVVCEWRSAGIELTETTLDATLVRDAAARAEKLWDLPEPPAGMGSSGVRVNIR